MEAGQLQYEPSAHARPVVVERDGGVTRIFVAMQGVYAPVPEWVWNLDVFSLVVAPLCHIGSALIRMLMRCPKPPRAVVEIGEGLFTLSMCDRLSGKTTVISFPRAAVAEARANRYERGLWLNVLGHIKTTYLTDLPRDTMDRLDAALHWALGDEEASGPPAGFEFRRCPS